MDKICYFNVLSNAKGNHLMIQCLVIMVRCSAKSDREAYYCIELGYLKSPLAPVTIQRHSLCEHSKKTRRFLGSRQVKRLPANISAQIYEGRLNYEELRVKFSSRVHII